MVIGRDRFFALLGRNGLKVPPLPRSNPKTTSRDSKLPTYPNLIRGLEVVRPNQVWVSDITYIRTNRGFLYLFLTMDVSSRKIVGYHVSRDLKAHGAVQTLKKASKFLRPGGLGPAHEQMGKID